MPYASNALDACRVYFEEDGYAEGDAIVVHGGLLDCVDDVRDSGIVKGLAGSEYRLLYVDHRGLGRSDKPRDGEAYAMPRRVADVVAVLDALGIERAHFIGMSWGGRLGYGIGEHASDRVLSLVCGGQQPYAWPDSPLSRVVTTGVAAARKDGIDALVRALEGFWNVRFSEPMRTRWLQNDPAALEAAWTQALAEGPVAGQLRTWKMPCLILMGAEDADFLDGARRAATEIPNAELLLLDEADHYAAHIGQSDVMRDAVLRTLAHGSRVR